MAVTAEGDRLNKKTGRKGEKQACAYLKKQGYKILERGFKTPFGEVDIVAKREDVIVFTEVKTRLSDTFGAPCEAVDERKKFRYRQSAKYYFAGRQIDITVRFDIIEIYRGEINHIENAFF